MRAKKLHWSIGAALVLAGGLMGCVQVTQVTTGRPVAIQRDGSAIVVAVCKDLQVSGLTMQEREYPKSWQTFWEFDSGLTIHAGDKLSPALAADLGVAEGHEPTMSANHEVAVYFHVDPSVGNYDDEFGVSFLIAEGGLSETEWLHDDGSLSSEPCS